MNRIKRVSLFFRVIFQMIFIAMPVMLVAAWLTNPESITLLGGAIQMSFIPSPYIATASHGSGILHVLTGSEKLLGFGVSTIPMLIELYIVYSLIKLFSLYERGEIFSINHVRYIRNIGYALLMSQLINPIYEGVMGLVLTWHNPHGHRFAAISFDQTNVGIVITALLVILISWIMAEGYKLREEQQLTI